jgi:hypothetical protein
VSGTVAIRYIDLSRLRSIDDLFLPLGNRRAPNPRERLKEIATDRGVSFATLSRVIGRNAAYVQQYVERGSPKRLPEDDRRRLAIYLNVDERELGARDPWMPPTTSHTDARPARSRSLL